jgi:hypothetical protein
VNYLEIFKLKATPGFEMFCKKIWENSFSQIFYFLNHEQNKRKLFERTLIDIGGKTSFPFSFHYIFSYRSRAQKSRVPVLGTWKSLEKGK